MALRIGIDIGSTTVKVVVLDEQNKLLFRSYERHYSKPGSAPVRPCGDSGAFWGTTGSTAHYRLRRTGRGKRRRHRLCPGGLCHRRRGTGSSFGTDAVIELGERTPKSFSSAIPWRSG